MAKLARDVMTPDPACCSPQTTVDEIAKLMREVDCGEIPVLDASDRIVGVVTDRDIVCRVVAAGGNPIGYTAEACMSRDVITVSEDTSLKEVVATMTDHQIRRVPVVAADGHCVGIIAQADVAREMSVRDSSELVREVSQESASRGSR
jgi:CBS domain-containing protein